MSNQAWILASRPGSEGMVLDNFKLEDIPMPEPLAEGEVLLKAKLVSVDPYMRGRMTDEKKSYVPAFALGAPLAGSVGSEVVESKHPNLKAGDVVTGFLPWQKFCKAGGSTLAKAEEGIPLEKNMSSCSYSGMSCYLPIMQIGEPKKGETAFVSAAAGAVGSMACQILIKSGCTVVGSAGTAEKIAFLESIGVKAFNYKDKSSTLAAKVAAACPNGIDIYFENVGGETLEVVLENMNDFGRIIACGMISQYDLPAEEMYGVKNLVNIVKKRLKFQGFIGSDWRGKPEWDQAKAALVDMVRKGEVTTQETIVDGFEQVPSAFLGLFTGQNTGKMLVRC